jgi:CRP-like cAMP-binding protein
VEEGSCLIQRPTVGFISLQRGDLIGGISFLSHSAKAEKGPLKIVEQGSIFRWDLALMRKITEDDPQLEAALTDGFARQFSDDFLKGDGGELRDGRTGHSNLSRENLTIHAEFFPFLTQFQLLRLIGSGERIELKPQDTSSCDYRLVCLYEGNVNVNHQDQDNVSLAPQPTDGMLYLAQHAPRRLSIQASQQGAKLICWKDEVLDEIELQEPRMYIGILKSILERKRESQNAGNT